MEAVLYRHKLTSMYTIGKLVYGDTIHATIERPWLGNAANISCIPSGSYTCKFIKRSASGKYRNVYHIIGVPGRSGILIHAGNLVRHSRGCVILGTRHGKLVNRQAVLNSRSAVKSLADHFKGEDFILHVIGERNVNDT